MKIIITAKPTERNSMNKEQIFTFELVGEILAELKENLDIVSVELISDTAH